MAFSIFFYTTLMLYDYEFSSLYLTFSSMVGRSVCFDDTFELDVFRVAPWFVATVYFLCYFISIAILFVNLFIAVICFYFTIVRKESYTNKYNIVKYLKYVLTRDAYSDLLHQKNIDYRTSIGVEEKETLRLKGGGNSKSKSKMKKTRFGLIKINEKSKCFARIRESDFVKKRLPDVVEYRGIPYHRLISMKALLLSFLIEDENKKSYFREQAILTLFLSIITSSRNSINVLINKNSEKYFMGECSFF